MYPPIFNTFMQMSTMHLLLSQNISILQIKMMGVLVVAKTALLSLQVVHATNKEVGTLCLL